MALTAGVISLVSETSTTVNLSATAATGGTGAVTYQWYRSTTSGFTPGGGNILTGQTALTLADTGLIPNTGYFYKLQATDTVPTTVTYTQFAVVTNPAVLNPNQFQLTPFLGMLDLRFDYDTVSAKIDITQATPLYAGAAVKWVPATSPNSLPSVIGCAANSDEVFGFINFDIKTTQYVAGSLCELSIEGNVMYLFSTGAITQGSQVTLDLTTMGGVAQKVPSSGNNIVGWAYDGAASAGTLIRVKLLTPSFLFA